MSAPVPFALVGGGWRAEFFLRVARALPDRFRVARIVARDPAKGRALEERWGVPTVRAPAELDPGSVRFAVVSVPAAAAPEVAEDACGRGLPVLLETPPAPDEGGLLRLWRLAEAGAVIEVAEQYPLQPLHAARIALARSGRIGRPSFAHVSEAHGYHGMALIRRLLGLGCEEAIVTARRFEAPVVAGPDRAGPPAEERVKPSGQVIAHLDFGDRLGVHDFSGEQYFSWIRSRSTLLRGERGEIRGHRLSFLADHRTPVHLDLARHDAGEEGNLEGLWHRGYLAGGEWAYLNPFPGAALSDDEIAVASSLAGMARRLETGEPCYPLAEAAQDQWLALCAERALRECGPVRATAQPWAEAAARAA